MPTFFYQFTRHAVVKCNFKCSFFIVSQLRFVRNGSGKKPKFGKTTTDNRFFLNLYVIRVVDGEQPTESSELKFVFK